MQRMILVTLTLFVAIMLCSASLARAQSPPGGPMPQQPPAQGGPSPSQGPPPPNGLRPDGQPNRGRQQPPPDLPVEVLNAPHQGPSTRLPPGVSIPIPRNQDEARQIQEQYRPQLQAAADASRAATDTHRRMAERVRSGDHSLPTAAERGLGSGYSPTQQRAVPPPRSESPVERALNLLRFENVAAVPDAQPEGSPDADPSLQSVADACAVYSIGWQETFGYDDWLGAEALNTCSYGITSGILPLYRIDHLNTNMHAYRCSWYFNAWNLCLAPQYWATFYPYCDLYGQHAYQWCGPNYWEPEYFGAGYFVRSFGSVTTTDGLFGYAVNDSANIPYHCDPAHWSGSCS